MLLEGARVLLTGASGGIGTALSDQLLARGADLLVSGRDRARLPADGSGGRVRAVAADLADEREVHRLARAAGRIDVLINNAGLGWYGETASMPCAGVRALVDVNVAAPLLLTRLLLPGMLERRHGAVVFVGSVAGRLGVEREAVYSATKAALCTYADALRAEVGRQGVEVLVISLGAVDTDYFRRRGADYQRSWPAALTADNVARLVVAGIEQGRQELFAPSWLRIPAVLHDRMPGLYRGLANRFG